MRGLTIDRKIITYDSVTNYAYLAVKV